jgi:hypothetical protein
MTTGDLENWKTPDHSSATETESGAFEKPSFQGSGVEEYLTAYQRAKKF